MKSSEFKNIIIDSNFNNISDIISLYNSGDLNELLSKDNKNIKVISKINRYAKSVNLNYQILNNLDNYISFLKEHIYIDQLQLRYIISLTINNKENFILKSTYYYPEYASYYNSGFIKLFMHQYNKNIKLFDGKIKKRNFNELAELMSKNKKRTFAYFEDINANNLNYFLAIIYKSENSNQ